MPQALITVNGVAGSNTDLPIDTLVQLGNTGIGGETTYTWQIVDQPPGTADSLSATNIVNPQITPKKENTYLIRLTVNLGLADETSDQVVLGIRDLKADTRVPAAGESTEASLSVGWATDVALCLKRNQDLLRRGGAHAAVAGASLAYGQVCRVSGVSTIKSGLPDEEPLMQMNSANASSTTQTTGDLFICLGNPDGTTPVAVGAVGLFMPAGVFKPTAALGGSAGDIVYVSDTGTLALTSGTRRRAVGQVSDAGGSHIYFNGVRRGPTTTILYSLTTTGTGNQTLFLIPGGPAAATVDAWYMPMPQHMRITAARVYIDDNAHDAEVAFKIYKEGVLQATVTVAAATANTSSILTTPIEFTAGDRLSVIMSTTVALTVAGTRCCLTLLGELW